MDALAIAIDTTADYTRRLDDASGATHTTTAGCDLVNEITNFLAGDVRNGITQALQDTITLAGHDANGEWVTLTYTK